MSAIKRKKLYFDVSFQNATTNASRAFPCTQFRASYSGDLYGGVLDDLPALVAGSPADKKRANDVAAWFQAREAAGTGTTTGLMKVDFINATTGNNTGTALNVTSPFTQDGSTPIFTRHFAVRVRKLGAATVTGRLYVQRQHSIEV